MKICPICRKKYKTEKICPDCGLTLVDEGFSLMTIREEGHKEEEAYKILKYGLLREKWKVKRTVRKIQEGRYGGFLGEIYEAESVEFGSIASCIIQSIDLHPYAAAEMREEWMFELMDKSQGKTNLFTIYDFDILRRKVLIRTENLTSLQEYLKMQKNISDKQLKKLVIKMGIDICKGLEECENEKIKHGTFGIDDIFVNKSGIFKLNWLTSWLGYRMDIEWATIASDYEWIAYKAPEAMIWGEKEDYCSDIYSLGITMYQLLNDGNLPFMSGGEDIDEVVYETIEKRKNGEEILPPRNGQKELWKIIQKATRLKKEDRYQSASEMRADLEELQLRKKIKTVNSLKIEQMKNEIGVLKQDILELKNLEKEIQQLNFNSVLNCNVVGNTIFFGRYPQDEDGGVKPIEWTVMKTEKNKMLLLSKYVLDTQPYNKKDEKVTWEISDIRRWLNSNFYTTAFNNMEQGKIADTLVKTENNPKYRTIGGNDTEDKVFLLSVEEVEENFQNEEERRAKTTAYAEKSVICSNEKYAYWVLRTMGDYNCRVVGVRMEGDLMMDGIEVSNVAFGVRPALWINL